LTAAQEAAAQLLDSYRGKWADLIPVELHRVAWTLDASIETVENLAGGARLVPVKGGFRILVGSNLPSGRYRTSVAHELAHTLFYVRDGSLPRRVTQQTKSEEDFCFDVARYVLAPMWLMDSIGINDVRDPAQSFRVLRETLKLSTPVAARVLLHDYHLFSGVAGQWSREEGNWHLQRGRAYASPDLNPSQRARLRRSAQLWLEERTTVREHHIFEEPLGSPDLAFVLVFSAPPERSSPTQERTTRVQPATLFDPASADPRRS
jgi:hypothetical protein